MPGSLLALMPLAAALQIGLGHAAGRLVTSAFSFPDEQARDVNMCCTFANSGPLPLIFADALFSGHPAILADVTACVSFYLLVWSPLFWSFGRVILGTYGSGGGGGADDEDDAENQGQGTAAEKVVREIKNILSPPVIGSILGVAVGSVPVLRRAFFGGLLTPVMGALSTLGTAYLPAAILVLAGSLVGKKDGAGSEAASAAETATGPSKKALVSIFLSRFVLSPILSFGLLSAFSRAGLLGRAGTRARAVVSFVLLMEGCTPPAQNSVIMLQLEKLQDRARNMAQLLTILYTAAVIPVTILLSACLTKSGIMPFLN
jgi:predicted permease